jgi:hypothetical protein
MFQITPITSSDDVRALNRALREIEPGLVREMRKEFRAIAKPVEQQIKKNIPAQAPLSGMTKGEGRLRWLGDIKPQKTSISSALKASGRSLTAPLVRIVMMSPAVSMADMAGRVNKSRPISREYNYRLRDGSIIKRKHRVTTQGKHMIRNLPGKPSRYGWSALESRIDQVERAIDQVLEKYYRIANRDN